MGVDQYQLGTRGYGTHQAILDLVQPGARLLDVGAAGGYLSELAQKTRQASVLAVEPDATGCAECRARGVDVLEGDVADLLASGAIAAHGPFDQVLLADVLEHMPDPAPVLAQIVDLLHPGGTAIVSVPNIAYVRARLSLLAGRWRYEDTGIFDRTHLRFFDRRGITELVQSAGLTVEQEIPIGPGSYALGRNGLRITRLRPSLLASQFVLLGRRSTT
jgi:methionine biosynthesis protein MetW